MTTLAATLSWLLDGADAHARALALLARCGGIHRLRRLTVPGLQRTGFVTAHEARRLAAAFRIAVDTALASPCPALRCPADVLAVLPELALAPTEEVWVIPVDVGLRALECRRVALGAAASCAVTVSDVLSGVVANGATSFFLCHNHPSGDPRPSQRDRAFTRSIESAARILGVELLDHLVVAGHRWHSCCSGQSGVSALASAASGAATQITRRSSTEPTPAARPR